MADEIGERRGYREQLQAVWADMPPARRRVLLGAVGLVFAGLLYLAFSQATAPSWKPLSRGMLPEDQQAAVTALEARQIPYQLADGGTLLVPEERIHEARLELATSTMPSGRSVGFELFDESELGRSSFAEKVNYHRALEGELGRTIRAVAAVERARVHLTLPERHLFEEEQVEPSASVVLTLKPGTTLDRKQVQAIRQLVAGGVERLQPGRVSVVDQSGTMLAPVDGPDFATEQSLEYQARYEAALQRRVVALLEPVLGAGRVRAQVAADLDFSRLVETQETFDPEGQVIRSERERTEKVEAAPRVAAGAPGTATNVPDRAQAADANQPAGAGARTQEKLDHIKNYEIDRQTTRRETPHARVKRLSVAVVVDAGARAGEEAPDEAALASYRSLVAKAVGADEARGDAVEIVAMPFAVAALEPAAPEAVPSGVAGIPLATAGILAAVVLLLAVLGLVLWLRARKRRAEEAREAERLAALEEEVELLPGLTETVELQARIAELRERAQRQGAEDIRRTASVIRRWLGETPGEGAA